MRARRSSTRKLAIAIAAAVCALALAASALGRTTGTVSGAAGFDPAQFAQPTTIDNPWLPLRPGMQSVYAGTTIEGTERVHHRLVSTVTDLTKVIGGVRTVVVWDRDFSSGRLVEAEVAFFAQDTAGNVWELGEHPEEYEDGRIVASPTWIHGVARAQAGISMKAAPRAGTPSYSLGWAPAVSFTDRARVLKVGQRTCIPAQCFARVLLVDEFNPDQPGKNQLKYYAPGVGNVRVAWSGVNEDSKETLVLMQVARLGPAALARARTEALKLEQSAYRISKSTYGRTAPAEVAPAQSGSLGWARLAARPDARAAAQRVFTTRSPRIVITARVTSLPSLARGIKIDVIRPDGRIVGTTWLHAVSHDQTVRVTLARPVFASHPGKWRARFVVQRSVRSVTAFAVRQAP
jgi:hypothetical protein